MKKYTKTFKLGGKIFTLFLRMEDNSNHFVASLVLGPVAITDKPKLLKNELKGASRYFKK